MMIEPKLRRPAFIAIFIIYAIYLGYLPTQNQFLDRRDPVQAAVFWRASSPIDFFNKMARYGLSNPQQERPLQLRLLHSIAFDFKRIEPSDLRKHAFCDMLVPQVLLLNRRVNFQRESYLTLCDKLPEKTTADSTSVAQLLSRSERRFLNRLREQYRTANHNWLLDRMQPIPPSLVLAQAALESAWGSSRFAREGNNLFGIWTWGEEGLLPQSRQQGKQHRVASFHTILAGIERYYELLNTLPAYADFRHQRNQDNNPILLASCLQNYSAKGEGYGELLGNIIRYNGLTNYDSLGLAGD